MFEPALNAVGIDPPVQVTRWHCDGPLDLAVAPPPFEAGPEAWAQARAHQAIWVNGHPGAARAEAGARMAVYTFDGDLPPLALPDAAILFDRAGVVAVNKPARLATCRSRSSALRCVEALLRLALQDPDLRAVHRLDRDTSGVVLFARSGPIAGQLHRQFRARTVEKRYLARVAPEPAAEPFVVTGGIARVRAAPGATGHLLFELRDDGKPSQTRFTPLGGGLVRAAPITGRTHQLRVHLASVGCPIAGDPLYGGVPAARMGLHAESIEFDWEGARIRVEAPPPPWFYDSA